MSRGARPGTRAGFIDWRRRAHTVAGVGAAVLVAAVGLGPVRGHPEHVRVQVQLLGVNDLHGHLRTVGAGRRDGRRVALGGVAWLAAHLDRAEREFDGPTIRMHAGDMVGASPMVSSYFHDEPAMRAMNLMRFDVGTLGNHEFDEGGDELLRLLRGGRRTGPTALKPAAGGGLVNTSAPDYEGARFPYVAANTVDREGRLRLPPYLVLRRGGVRIGFIGVTTPTTPRYLLPRFARRFRFTDMSDAVNRWASVLSRRGVRAIVVLAHSGAAGDPRHPAGEIVDEARQMSAAVDVVVAGHTHSELDARVPNARGGGYKLLVQGFSFGVAYDRVRLTIDPGTGEVVSKSAAVERTWHEGVRPHPRVAALVRRYSRRVAALARRVVGRAKRDYLRDPRVEPGAASLPRLAAAAQRTYASTDVAVVNGGNLRDDLDAGRVEYSDLLAAEAYEHPVMRMRIRGSRLRRVLEEQWLGAPVTRLALSGLAVRYDLTRPPGRRVVEVRLADGRPLEPGRTYTLAANELLATGERFPALRDGAADRRRLGTDLDALRAYLERRRVLR